MYDVTTIGVSASVIAAGLLYTLLQGEDAEVGKFRTASGHTHWLS